MRNKKLFGSLWKVVDGIISTDRQIVISTALVTKTSDYTATDIDHTILADGSSNTVTILLPSAVGNAGKIYNIKCIDDTFACDVDAAGTEKIDGELTVDLIKHESITIQSDNTEWWIL